jgi:hypothetical protein
MPDLWIMQSEKPINPTHVAISGQRSAIDQFHAAALAAGGTDNGAPGLRPDYHEHYYAAYALDPEGNNIEVVCHYPNGVPPAPPAKAAAKKSAKSSANVKKKAAKSSAKAAKTTKKSPAKAAKAAKKPAPKAAKKSSGKAKRR